MAKEPSPLQIARAWHGVTDRWIVRRDKMHDTKQWEVVHDWGRDLISDDTMKVVGRFHTGDEADKLQQKLENAARGAAVLKLFKR